MTDREAMKIALEAFEDLKKSVTRDGTVSENWDAYYEKEYSALEALRQALAQPEQTKCPRCGEVNPAEIHTCSPQVAQEPVAWVKSYDIVCSLLRQVHDILATTQYPIKRPWVGLTDEEIDYIFGLAYADDMELLRTIEAKLKDKNG